MTLLAVVLVVLGSWSGLAFGASLLFVSSIKGSELAKVQHLKAPEAVQTMTATSPAARQDDAVSLPRAA